MIDAFTINLVVAVVTITAAVLYLLETLLRREVGSGRVWALGFLSGVLTVASYLVWRATPDPWVAVAIGNAALASTLGLFWLGCRSFNGRSLQVPGAVVAAVALAQVALTLSAGPDGGDWAGSELLFFAVSIFALMGAIESRRGAMGATWSSLGLTVVLVAVAAFYFARLIVLVSQGPDSSLFTVWFGSGVTGMVSIVLTIVVLTTATMLRSGRVTLRHDGNPSTLEVGPDGLLNASSFHAALTGVLHRARESEDPCAVVSLRIDDLNQIGVAFGADEEASIWAHLREGLCRYAPTFALLGEGASRGVVFAFEPTSEGHARRVASRVQRLLLDDFAERGSAVIPVVGVGVALSSHVGYDAEKLVVAAETAARRSSTSVDASVIVADATPR